MPTWQKYTRVIMLNLKKVIIASILSACILSYAYIGQTYLKERDFLVKRDTMFESSLEPMRVLVTGGAGFIGFHLTKTLVEQKGKTVVVIDNFNDYYDIRLKMDRAYELNKLQVTVYNDDVCNSYFLHEVFEQYKFTHVVHLAAQAGVRYSLDNPLAYLKANIECQVKLLEVMKHFQGVKLVYASSSSVYGKQSAIPFNIKENTDHPSNLYAVTKKTDELLGYEYCETFNLTSIGLRFFTVYGPWGRPDMAIFKFADNLIHGHAVPLFHSKEKLYLARDFTYIDDIISGIIGALHYHPTKCGERFNLGYGGPVKVADMLDMLQKELNVTAKIKNKPLPPTDLLQTWADISLSRKLLKFNPATSLEQGIRKFVIWYKGYLTKRRIGTDNNAVNMFYDRLVKERIQRQNISNKTLVRELKDTKSVLLETYMENVTMHIVVSTDHNDYVGIPTLLNSLLKTSTRPLVFHITIVNITKETMQSFLKCHQFHGLQPYQVEIHEFTADWFDDDYLQYINVQSAHYKNMGRTPNHENLKGSHGNFARFFFHRLMPNVRKIIYMDVDTVAVKDIQGLWESISEDTVVGGIYKKLHYSRTARDIYKKRYNRTFPGRNTFNAGVYTMNLDQWRANEKLIDQNIHFWMKTSVQYEGALWGALTQPLMHFGFAGFIHTINKKEYNLNMLGVSHKVLGSRINVAKGVILHYNGPLKPWLGKGAYVKYWTQHQPPICSNQGLCTRDTLIFGCHCLSGYDGYVCEIKS